MKSLRFILLFVLSAAFAWPQAAPISGQAWSQYGQPIPYAQVRVCSVTSTGTPCVPTIPIFYDYNLSRPAPNPYAADQYGNYTVYVPALSAPNLYVVQLTPASGITWSYVMPGPDIGASGPIIQVNGVNLIAASPVNFLDSATVSWTNPSAGVVQASVTAGLVSPLTTKGDIWGYSTTNARIPIGTDATVLTADSTQPLGVKWATPASSGITALTGDVTGTGPGSTVTTVVNIPPSVTLTGTPSVGMVPTATGTNAATWQTPAAGCSGAACVAYQPNTTNFVFISNSDVQGNDHGAFPGYTITGSVVCTGGVTTTTCIAQMANTFVPGDWIETNSITGISQLATPVDGRGTYIDQIIASGTTSTQFAFTVPAVFTATCASSCGSVANGNALFSTLACSMTFFNGHGNCLPTEINSVGIAATNTLYPTLIHPLMPAVTGNPAFVITYEGTDDLDAGTSLALMESGFQTHWENIHTDGGKVVAMTFALTNYNTVIGPCSGGTNGSNDFACIKKVLDFNNWMRAQSCANRITTGTVPPVGACWDYLSDAESLLRDPNDTEFRDVQNFTAAGNYVFAQDLNNVLSNQGSRMSSGQLGQNLNTMYGQQIIYADNAGTFITMLPSVPTGDRMDWVWAAPRFLLKLSGNGLFTYDLFGTGSTVPMEVIGSNAALGFGIAGSCGAFCTSPNTQLGYDGTPAWLAIGNSNTVSDATGGLHAANLLGPAANPTVGAACTRDNEWELGTAGGVFYCDPATHNWASFSVSSSFGSLTSGTNSTAAMHVSSTATLTVDGGTFFKGTVNPQVGTTYAFVAADNGKLLTLNNAASIAVSLSQATVAGFTTGATFDVSNLGAGTATITPTTSTINGTATLVLGSGEGAHIVSDGTNYSAQVFGNPSAAGVSSVTATAPITANGISGSAQTGAVTVACPTCTTGGGTNVQINGGAGLATSNQDGYLPYKCSDTSTSGTAQSCTSSTSFTPGAVNCFTYSTTTTNSGTGLTINVNALGAKSVAIPGTTVGTWTTTLTAGAIPANSPIPMCYDGTNMNAYVLGGSGGSAPPIPYPPSSASFTWVNQGSDTVATQGNYLVMTQPSDATLNWRLMTHATPATPWRASASLGQSFGAQATIPNAADVGLYLYDGVKLMGIEDLNLHYALGSPGLMRIERITNVTTDGSTVFSTTNNLSINLGITMRNTGFVAWCSDGTNLYAQYSVDGNAPWVTYYSEAVGAFITPTAVGWGGVNQNTGVTIYTFLKGWNLATVSTCNY